ncbi:FadR/GntR family transcriptional regulator [Caballeronia insecticola]|uniref:GntR domain-containing protein n=1 Tax=Caballeronia insecticola TaxID=758793 RepID=R4X5F8_9BURK|nr:FadR/GntR family transcriptional regulator [Caballeronia insecticola]BAN28167.1 GntR domain-containing protein [Caballeronia insecticola]
MAQTPAKQADQLAEDVETRHLPDEIAARLNQAIASGEFAVGDRLPSERLLCEQFSVSRAVVREALSQLKSEGLVTSRAGSGVFVTERNQRQAFRIQDVVVNETDSLALVLELLVTIEVASTRLAALRRTPEDLKKIRRALVGMEYEIANDRLGDEEDFAFHQAIVHATHNPHFQALSEHLEHGARRVIRQARSNTKNNHADLVEDVQKEHKAIYDAISAGNAEQAELAAETHLRNAAKRLDVYLTK